MVAGRRAALGPAKGRVPSAKDGGDCDGELPCSVVKTSPDCEGVPTQAVELLPVFVRMLLSFCAGDGLAADLEGSMNSSFGLAV